MTVQVGIVPRDLARSLAFYRDELGLPYLGGRPVIEGRTLHFFDSGDGGNVKLLEQPPEAPVPSMHAPSGPFQAATGLRWLTLDVADLDPIAERCRDRVFQMPVTELRAGLRICIVEDPDGNAVELVERR
jgi:catechol 2,3-dioxygenase-like lactoylglutathione lyase family enzyme